MDIQRPNLDRGADLAEKARRPDGTLITLNRRLYMQLLAFGGASGMATSAELSGYAQYAQSLAAAHLPAVLYADLNDPHGLALLTCTENPADFLTRLRPVLNAPPFSALQLKPEFTMLGRTYAIGYEDDLERTLITRPMQRVTDPSLPWAVWYPLRRSGDFEHLPPDEQRTILMEHGGIGRAYGEAGLAYDIRLACFGLDKSDNDFVIGLLGADLFPLSAIVERMRKTRQTSRYLTHLGPFFVGKAVWQSKLETA